MGGQNKKMNTKKVQRTIRKNVMIAKEKGDELQKIAMKEYEKVQKQMNVATKKVAEYIKKNPKKAIAISAGIGAALGAAIAGLTAVTSKKKKK
jgi:ElaB/YqjD/DUF883 family membrane-anchored ribosome-binding protein